MNLPTQEKTGLLYSNYCNAVIDSVLVSLPETWCNAMHRLRRVKKCGDYGSKIMMIIDR